MCGDHGRPRLLVRGHAVAGVVVVADVPVVLEGVELSSGGTVVAHFVGSKMTVPPSRKIRRGAAIVVRDVSRVEVRHPVEPGPR